MKQQASLLSFFGRGEKKKLRGLSDAKIDEGVGVGGGNSFPSSPARKQIEKSSKSERGDVRLTAVFVAVDVSATVNPRNDDGNLPCLMPAISNEGKAARQAINCAEGIGSTDSNDDGSAVLACSGHSRRAEGNVFTLLPIPSKDSTTATTGESSSGGDDEEEEEKDSSDDDDSSTTTNILFNHASNGSKITDDCAGVEGKSAYELFREKNIARNNARLRALGLLTSVDIHHQNKMDEKSQVKRKKSSISGRSNKVTALPTRRSSRLRKHMMDVKGTVLAVHHDGDSAAPVLGTNNKSFRESSSEVDEDEFTVSPLIEYQMTTCNANHESYVSKIGRNDVNGAEVGVNSEYNDSNRITTLIPRASRLVPPSGLSAIYTLQFHPDSWGSTTTPSQSNKNDIGGWLVGAGKAGLIAVWDCYETSSDNGSFEARSYIEPVISWKGHSGRWIADARFLPIPMSSSSSPSFNEVSASSHCMAPGRLLTAGNDGTVCHWDLTSTSVKTGAPKLLWQSGKSLHSSGIFSMDVCVTVGGSLAGGDSDAGNSMGAYIVTGSKDKSIVVITLSGQRQAPSWRSNFHHAKVASVSFSASCTTPLIASASDDGMVAVHDARLDGMKGNDVGNGVVARLENAHVRPHSAIWMPESDSLFMTAGLDEVIKLWDLRNISFPIASYHGHVPGNGRRLRRIHRPTFFNVGSSSSSSGSFILSGGEGSHAVSMFRLGAQGGEVGSHSINNELDLNPQSVFSRGKLPADVGDIAGLAVRGRGVAAAVEGGEVLLLSARA